MLADDLIGRLAQLDTPAVSDALDALALPGRVTGLKRFTTRRRITGRVLTVKLGAGPAIAGPPRHLCTQAVEAASPGDILAIEQRSGVEAAGWGGILSNGALVKKISGVIVDGPVRDIDESAELKFPVFARSAIPTTARGRIVEEAFNKPITIGEVTVKPGDLALADGSGICFLAQEHASRLIETAELIAKREKLMTERVLAGEPISKVMGLDYEQMLEC